MTLPVDVNEGGVNEIGIGSVNWIGNVNIIGSVAVIGRVDPDKTGGPALTIHVIVNSLGVIGRGSFDGIGNDNVIGCLDPSD